MQRKPLEFGKGDLKQDEAWLLPILFFFALQAAALSASWPARAADLSDAVSMRAVGELTGGDSAESSPEGCVANSEVVISLRMSASQTAGM